VGQQAKGPAFEATISLLDFVTIGLASALLLFVMVRDRENTAATEATTEEALGLVRASFAERSAARLIELEGNFYLGRPDAVPAAEVAPPVIRGKDVTGLPMSSRVRRVEILVQDAFPLAEYPGSLTALTRSLLNRGIRHAHVRGFGSAAPASAYSVVSDGDSAWPALADALRLAAGDGGPPLGDVLAQAIFETSTSATPLEPIIVLLDSPVPGAQCAEKEVAVQILVSGFRSLPGGTAGSADLGESVSRLLTTCGGDAVRMYP
jgi:hypothetical protein